jgi:outer membrane protein assembly factor BamE (lipoprotein component of BamABCDE complex)
MREGNLRKAVLSMIVGIALSGCMSSGTKVSEVDAEQFQKGVTTEAEVIAKLGVPTATAQTGDIRVITYSYVSAKPDAVDFIPVVGLLAGGAKAQATLVSFTFNASGVLTGYSAAASNSSLHSGIAQ